MVQIASSILFPILLVPILANPIPQPGATDISALGVIRSLEDIAQRAPVVADARSGSPGVPKAPVTQPNPKTPPKGTGKTKNAKSKSGSKSFELQKPKHEFPI